MRDSHTGNYPVGSNCEHDGHYCCYLDYRNTCFFLYFPNHRCTASGTGASGGCKNYGINTSLFQFLANGLAETLGISYRCTGSGSTVNEIMKLAENPFFFHLSHNIKGKDYIGIIVRIYPVITSMDGLVIFRCKVFQF